MFDKSSIQKIANMQQQKGAVLVISLVVLLILTLIGITSLRSTSLEQKIAGNIKDINIALQASESAVRTAEAYIENLSDIQDFGTEPGLYLQGESIPDPFSATTWKASASLSKEASKIGDLEYKPRYFIEEMGQEEGSQSLNMTSYGAAEAPPVGLFRIVAQGRGPSGVSQILLEVFYGKMF